MGMGSWMMGSWTKDLRIAARNLARRPTFAIGVALTLGLGIGATTTIYSVVDGVMLRPLPYNDPSTLVAVGTLVPRAEWVDGNADLQNLDMISFPNFLDLRERARSFEELTAILLAELTVDVGSIRVAGVSEGLFQMLDVSPALGRIFSPEEYIPIFSPVVVLSYGTWQRRMPRVSDALSRRKWRKAWRAMATLRRDYMVCALGARDGSTNWSAIDARFEGPRQAMLDGEGYQEYGLGESRLWSNDYITVEVEEGGIPSDQVLADWHREEDVV